MEKQLAEAREENAHTLPFHVKRLVTENEKLKVEIQNDADAQEIGPEIATIRTNRSDRPASDLRNIINA